MNLLVPPHIPRDYRICASPVRRSKTPMRVTRATRTAALYEKIGISRPRLQHLLNQARQNICDFATRLQRHIFTQRCHERPEPTQRYDESGQSAKHLNVYDATMFYRKKSANIFVQVYKVPRRPFESARLDAELKLAGEFGLRNKREIWRYEIL